MISLRADRRDVAAGARAMVPWLAGLVPFGLVIGVSAAQADIPALAGWLTGPLIYAGSSQAATIGMLDAGAAPMVVVASALIINIRLIFYSATMARYLVAVAAAVIAVLRTGSPQAAILAGLPALWVANALLTS